MNKADIYREIAKNCLKSVPYARDTVEARFCEGYSRYWENLAMEFEETQKAIWNLTLKKSRPNYKKQ